MQNYSHKKIILKKPWMKCLQCLRGGRGDLSGEDNLDENKLTEHYCFYKKKEWENTITKSFNENCVSKLSTQREIIIKVFRLEKDLKKLKNFTNVWLQVLTNKKLMSKILVF